MKEDSLNSCEVIASPEDYLTAVQPSILMILSPMGLISPNTTMVMTRICNH